MFRNFYFAGVPQIIFRILHTHESLPACTRIRPSSVVPHCTLLHWVPREYRSLPLASPVASTDTFPASHVKSTAVPVSQVASTEAIPEQPILTVLATKAIPVALIQPVMVKEAISELPAVPVVKSSQVTFIYIALLTRQIVTKQLHNIKMGK